MSEAIIIGPLIIKVSLVHLLGSFIIGLLLFWLACSWEKKYKRYYIDLVLSSLLFFTISLWGSKILINWSLFLDDPMAIVTFPSTTSSFYLAFCLMVAYVMYLSRKSGFKLFMFLHSFVVIFVMASFSFLFTQYLFSNIPVSLLELSLHFILLLTWLIIHPNVQQYLLASAGIVCLAIIKWMILIEKGTTVFGFPLSANFYAIISLFGIGLALYGKGRNKRWNQ